MTADNVFRGLTLWSKYLIDCGAALRCLPHSATVVLTLPRREFASGYLSLGAVLAAERLEWESICTRRSHDLRVGDEVKYASLKGTKALYGQVTEVKDDFVQVSDHHDQSLHTYSNDQCRVIVRYKSREDGVRRELSTNLAILVDLWGDIRARSFCIRTGLAAAVIGNESRNSREWSLEHVNTMTSPGVLVDFLRPARASANPDEYGRTVSFSNRKSIPLEDLFTTETIFVLDGARSWLKFSRRLEEQKRVILLDRSSTEFSVTLDQVLAEVSGEYLPFVNELNPPRGIEAYAYKRSKRGKF